MRRNSLNRDMFRSRILQASQSFWEYPNTCHGGKASSLPFQFFCKLEGTLSQKLLQILQVFSLPLLFVNLVQNFALSKFSSAILHWVLLHALPMSSLPPYCPCLLPLYAAALFVISTLFLLATTDKNTSSRQPVEMHCVPNKEAPRHKHAVNRNLFYHRTGSYGL